MTISLAVFDAGGRSWPSQ